MMRFAVAALAALLVLGAGATGAMAIGDCGGKSKSADVASEGETHKPASSG